MARSRGRREKKGTMVLSWVASKAAISIRRKIGGWPRAVVGERGGRARERRKKDERKEEERKRGKRRKEKL